MWLCGLIARVSVALRRTVVGSGDWLFDNLSGSHHQSQVTSAQVVETSMTTTNNTPSQDCWDKQTTLSHFPNYSDLPLLSSLFRLFPKIACMQQAPPSLRWKFLITWTLDSGYSKTSVPCTTCRQLVSYTKRFTKGVAIRCVLDTYSTFLTLESHDSSTKFYRGKRKFKTFALCQ